MALIPKNCPLPVLSLIALAVGSTATSALSATVAQREIQFSSVDFVSSVIELHNFGDVSVDLSGWRFCSHDEDQVRRYSGSTGLNGMTIAPGGSLFVHFGNDASASDEINISTIGGSFAGPFDQGAFAIQIYFTPVSFGDGNQIADHIQWSTGGVDNVSADERSDEAQAGGVWTDQSLWIPTTADTERIELTDLTGGELHSPGNYAVLVPEPSSVFLASFGMLGLLLRRRR